jgi:hypothetical protein
MHRSVVFSSACWLVVSCAPSGDLDAHARGSAVSVSDSGGLLPVGPATEALPPAGAGSLPPVGIEPSGADGKKLGPAPVALDDGTIEGAAGGSDAGAEPGPDPVVADASPPPADPDPPVLVAPPLPDDLIGAPVTGEIVFSDEAEWEVDGVFEPTFEVHTPTASYWVVKPLGSIVSVEDREQGAEQWVAFSSGFRPLRGVPSFPTPPATRVTTVRDDASQTPTHLRLTSESEDGLWQWVWDFYVTHVTFTVNRAPVAVGFAYQGVPGGVLGTEDRLVSSDGTSQGARNSFNADLPGPFEWAYIADTTLGRSLFLIQHEDDALAERYQVRDNDTSLWSFGSGQITALPLRFSMGIIPSVAHAEVAERVEFVAGAIE